MAEEKLIWKFFKDRGFSNYGIAAIMGNLFAVSGLNEKFLSKNFKVNTGYTEIKYIKEIDDNEYPQSKFRNDKSSFGIASWAYPSRKANLYNFVKTNRKSIADYETQLNFIIREMNSYNIYGKIKAATSIREASDLFLDKFERPSDKSESVRARRAGYGQVYYNMFAKDVSVVKPTTPAPAPVTKMKYDDNNKPIVCIMTNSTCYKGTKRFDTTKGFPCGVLWHSTGVNNPNIKRYVQPSDNDPNYATLIKEIGKNVAGNDWNHIKKEAGVNAWVGKLADGSVASVQALPWNYRPWGCGSGSKGSCNSGWIQFEICEDDLTSRTYFEKVYKEACELTAYLCAMYDIDPNGYTKYNGEQVPNILCHADSHKLGLGSNHADVLHWFKKFNKTMDDVRKDVSDLLKFSSIKPKKEEEIEENSSKYIVTASALNVRSGPSLESTVLRVIYKDTELEIEKEVGSWSKLKGKEAYVSSQYIAKI